MSQGQPHTMLSPVEKAVLAFCDQWRTLGDVQEELAGEFQPDRIPSSVAFLRRRRLLENWTIGERSLVDAAAVIYHQTELGVLVLQAQRRREAQADFTEGRMHLV